MDGKWTFGPVIIQGAWRRGNGSPFARSLKSSDRIWDRTERVVQGPHRLLLNTEPGAGRQASLRRPVALFCEAAQERHIEPGAPQEGGDTSPSARQQQGWPGSGRPRQNLSSETEKLPVYQCQCGSCPLTSWCGHLTIFSKLVS